MRKNILLLLLALFSFSAIHAQITSTLSDDGTLTISGTGDMPNYGDYKAPWYNDRDKIKTVVIEDGVTNIGNSAFEICFNLTSVEIPNSVTSIGDNAFNSCKSLTSVEIPNSVTSIGNGAFYHCSWLASITSPNSVTSIGGHAFYMCYGLSSIIVEEGNKYYDSRDNCNAIITTNKYEKEYTPSFTHPFLILCNSCGEILGDKWDEMQSV